MFCIIAAISADTLASEFDWVSVTIDNDLFVGSDNGYTNGVYFSLFDVIDPDEETISNDIWVDPLMWMIPTKKGIKVVNSYTIGQTMLTPSDIKVAQPDLNDLPYSAMLAMTNSFVKINFDHADRVSTTIGVIGPVAQGESTQKFFHELIGSPEPRGWDTQLKNELVFRFARARTWRSWVSESGNFDVLTHAEFGIGTISSAVSSGLTWRYGRDLSSSYASITYNSSRAVNPSAINGGWFIFGGIQAGYLFNQVFTDGNTFRDSRSIDYDKENLRLSAGLSYSHDNFSFTYALNDANFSFDGRRKETLDNLTEYGTLTFSWRF